MDSCNESRSTATKQKATMAQIPIGTVSYLSRKKRRTPENLGRYRRTPGRSWYNPYKVIDTLYDINVQCVFVLFFGNMKKNWHLRRAFENITQM